jgi:hypothetical protein
MSIAHNNVEIYGRLLSAQVSSCHQALSKKKDIENISHSRTVHPDIIMYFIYKLMHKNFALRKILKVTLKMLRHVSV